MATRSRRFIVHSPRARWVYAYDTLLAARREWPDRTVIEQKRTKTGEGWREWTNLREHRPSDGGS